MPINIRFLLIVVFMHSTMQANSTKPTSQWTIIGAGPAGIAVVGMLLDTGISPHMITWIDPEFNVGRLGKYYYNVPGNSKASTLHTFIANCLTFREIHTPSIERLLLTDPSSEPMLGVIIDPLHDITQYLIQEKHVRCIQDEVTDLRSIDSNHWMIQYGNGATIVSEHVVLATGCHPRELSYPVNNVIPLDKALNQSTLMQLVDVNDSVAVVGSAHSAVLVMKFLYEHGVHNIVNFYIHPFKYKYDMGHHNATTKTGLAGIAAQWAFEVLEHALPKNIIRVLNTQEERERWLPLCNKIVYATGYERNPVGIFSTKSLAYDNQTGVIAPGLFGIGIAFPESIKDFDRINDVYAIGLIDFIEFAQRVVPQWLTKQDGISYKHIDEPFLIDSL